MSLDVALCWQAVVTRDARQEGAFFYGVMTTGVFCRPGCSARRPKRENVRFYETTKEAELEGLRACQRCHPLGPASADALAARIRDLCDYIDQHADEPLTLAVLGQQVGMSTFHLQRTFRAVVGVSPKQYVDAVRMKRLQTLLRETKRSDVKGSDVTAAIFEAGYGSLSRVYEKSNEQLGMTPMEYREGGQGVEISWATAETPLGLMLIGATDRGLAFIQFGDTQAALLQALQAQYPQAVIRQVGEPSQQFHAWMAALQRYLTGHEPSLRLPVHVRATAFQLKVWRYLQRIPAGSVNSYSEVAKAIGQPGATRAVARACAANAVAIAIPCHRVIRGSGALGGYRWGLTRKRTLLDKERTPHQVPKSPQEES